MSGTHRLLRACTDSTADDGDGDNDDDDDDDDDDNLEKTYQGQKDAGNKTE